MLSVKLTKIIHCLKIDTETACKPAAAQIKERAVLARIVLVFCLLIFTINPWGYSYAHWGLNWFNGLLSVLKGEAYLWPIANFAGLLVVGVVLAIFWSTILRKTRQGLRSHRMLTLAMLLSIIALLWVLLALGFFFNRATEDLILLAEIIASIVVAAGYTLAVPIYHPPNLEEHHDPDHLDHDDIHLLHPDPDHLPDR